MSEQEQDTSKSTSVEQSHSSNDSATMPSSPPNPTQVPRDIREGYIPENNSEDT
jgi:hypothetical protein